MQYSLDYGAGGGGGMPGGSSRYSLLDNPNADRTGQFNLDHSAEINSFLDTPFKDQADEHASWSKMLKGLGTIQDAVGKSNTLQQMFSQLMQGSQVMGPGQTSIVSGAPQGGQQPIKMDEFTNQIIGLLLRSLNV